MAVTENMLIDIKVDAKGANEAVNGVKDKLSGLAKEVEKVGAKLSSIDPRLNKAFGMISNDINNVNKSMGTLGAAGEKASGMMAAFGSKVGSIGASMLVLNQAIELTSKAYGALVGPVKEAIDAFIEKEKVIGKLGKTLKIVGTSDVKTATQDWQTFAESVRKTSIVDAEQTIALVSLGKAMRINDELLKKMIITSVALASVTGDSLEGSFDRLAMTLKGEARSVAVLAPEVKQLTDYQIKQGAAIDVLYKKYIDFAKSGNSLAAKQKNLKILHEELYREMGKLLSTVIDFGAKYDLQIKLYEKAISVMSKMSGAMKELQGDFDKLKPIVLAVGTAIAAYFGPALVAILIKAGAAIIAFMTPIIAAAAPLALIAIKVAAVAIAIDLLVRNIDKLDVAFELAGKSWNYFVLEMEKGVNKIKQWLLELKLSIQNAFSSEILKMFGIDIDKANEKTKNAISGVKKEYESLGEEQKKIVGDINQTIESTKFDTGALGSALNIAEKMGYVFGDSVEKVKSINDALSEQEIIMRKTAEQARAVREEQAAVELYHKTVLRMAKEINVGYDETIQRQKILGDEFDRAIATYKEAQTEMQRVFKMNLDEREAAQKYADAEKKSIEARLEIEKLRHDTIKKMRDAMRTYEVELKRLRGDNVGAIKLERDIELKRIDEQIKGLEKLGSVRKRDADDMRKTREMLLKIYGIKVIDEEKKKREEINQVIENTADIETQAKIEAMRLTADFLQRDIEIRKEYKKAKEEYEDEVKKIRKKEESVGYTLEVRTRSLANMREFQAENNKLLTRQLILHEDIKKSIESQIADIEKSLGFADKEDALKKEYEIKKLIVARERDAYYQAGLITDETKEQYNYMIKMLDIEQKRKGLTEPGSQYTKMEKTGEVVAGTISNVFKQGSMEMVSGSMSIVSMVVQAISSMLDFFPQFVNMIKDVINKIADFPKVMKDAFRGLNASIINGISKMMNNWSKELTAIIEDLTRHLADQMPVMIERLMERLPDIIMTFMDKLPDLIGKLMEAIVSGLMKIVGVFIKMIIENGLKIMFNIMKTLWWEIPRMIIKGIIDGLSQIGRIFFDIFTKSKPKFDDTSVKKTIKAISDQLTADTSKIFAVLEMDNIKASQNYGEEMRNAISKAHKEGLSAWEKFLNFITKEWRNLWDSILLIWNGITEIWRGVWGTAMTTLLWFGETVTKAVTWLGEILTKWLDELNKLTAKFFETFSQMANALIEFGKTIVSGLIEAFKSIIEMFKNMWKTAIDNLTVLFSDIGKIFDNAWKTLKDTWNTVFDRLKSIGTDIWEGLKGAMSGATDIFKNMGANIWKGLEDGLKSIGPMLTKILNEISPANLFQKMFNIEGAKGQGTVEKALSKMGSEVDVPFIAFAKGGMVPGKSVVSGDSEMNDRILALLSPGEAIIPRSLMENDAIKALIKAVLEGKIAPSKYWGGSMTVGGVKIGVGDKGISINDQTIVPDPITAIGDELGQIIEPMGALWDEVKKKAFEMVLKMFEANHFHGGGLVPGFAGGGEVPAMLNPGEYVINAGAVRNIGSNYLDRMNKGNAPIAATTNFTINITTTEPIDESYFRNTLMPKIKDDIKRRTLNGEFLISSRGVR